MTSCNKSLEIPVNVLIKLFDQTTQSFRISNCLLDILLLYLKNLPLLHINTTVNNNFIYVSIQGKLLGGKGGFGSMLRSQGGRMSRKKVSNHDSCRNLDGIRIRAVKQASQLATWIKEEPERKRKENQEIEEKISSALNPPERRKVFRDQTYTKKSVSLLNSLENAFPNTDSSESDASMNDSESDYTEDETNSASDTSNESTSSAIPQSECEQSLYHLASSHDSRDLSILLNTPTTSTINK